MYEQNKFLTWMQYVIHIICIIHKYSNDTKSLKVCPKDLVNNNY